MLLHLRKAPNLGVLRTLLSFRVFARVLEATSHRPPLLQNRRRSRLASDAVHTSVMGVRTHIFATRALCDTAEGSLALILLLKLFVHKCAEVLGDLDPAQLSLGKIILFLDGSAHLIFDLNH